MTTTQQRVKSVDCDELKTDRGTVKSAALCSLE